MARKNRARKSDRTGSGLRFLKPKSRQLKNFFIVNPSILYGKSKRGDVFPKKKKAFIVPDKRFSLGQEIKDSFC